MDSTIYFPSLEGAIKQGEILSDVLQYTIDIPSLTGDSRRIIPVLHPYVIVVSQDCDLDWDFKYREGKAKFHKTLPSILLCEIHLASNIRGQEDINRDKWNNISNNKDERFHFLQKVESVQDLLNKGLPEFTIDFKRYFTIPTTELYAQISNNTANKRSKLGSPYLEHLCSRFYYYQSRIALPQDHFSEPMDKK